MKPILILTCLCFVGAPKVYDYSKKAWDLVATCNGLYNNEQRLRANFTHHTLLKLIVKPVAAPAMGPGPFMFVELGEGDIKVEFRVFVEIIDVGDNVLKLRLYNFKDGDKYSQGQFDTDKLAHYSKDDFWTDPTWVCGMEAIADGIFFGDWPVVTLLMNGTHPTWGVLILCDTISATIPVGADEIRDYIPYLYNRERDKFPLINPPADYVSPCDQQCCPCGKS